MLKPFYQGKLDVFCSIYAVLNALQITHGLRISRARGILHDTIMALADKPAVLRAVLDQRTDYVELVDGLLRAQEKVFSIDVTTPFLGANALPSPEKLRTACEDFLNGGPNRAVIFRFLKFLFAGTEPVNRHWTTLDAVNGGTLHLFDCSHEAAAIVNIAPDAYVTRVADVDADRLICIEPRTVRFVAAR